MAKVQWGSVEVQHIMYNRKTPEQSYIGLIQPYIKSCPVREQVCMSSSSSSSGVMRICAASTPAGALLMCLFEMRMLYRYVYR